MKVAPNALSQMALEPNTPAGAFLRKHVKSFAVFEECLTRFAGARMDVPRTNRSRELAHALLATMGYTDFGAFRDVVLNREESRFVAYDGQRDHSSHTVNNYLLGWYVRTHSSVMKKALEAALCQRGVPSAGGPWPLNDANDFFGFVWQFASLLHDIGYMFEGSIRASDLLERNEHTSVGTLSVRNYFSSRMWRDYHVVGRGQRDLFLAELGEGYAPPHFASDMALSEVADELRSIGKLDSLLSVTAAECQKMGLAEPSTTPPDAFRLWGTHYEAFASPKMANRVRLVSEIFEKLIVDGLPGPKVRILDHGVCSGLLQLLVSTYYYRMKAAATEVKAPSKLMQDFVVLDWVPSFWWTGIVWGTAACAVHNIQVMTAAKDLVAGWPEQLTLDEDPLAYLGVLVDVVQEWDRYPVRPTREREPVQGHEVRIGQSKGKVHVRFNGHACSQHADKVRAELNRSLVGWDDILVVD